MVSGVPAWGGGAAVGLVVVSRSRATSQGLQAFAPKGGARCLWRPSGGACAASGLGSEGWAGHWLLTVLLVVRSGSLVTSSPDGIRPFWWYQAGSPPPSTGNARLDTTKPARLASPADATRDPKPTLCESGAAAVSGALTPAAAGTAAGAGTGSSAGTAAGFQHWCHCRYRSGTHPPGVSVVPSVGTLLPTDGVVPDSPSRRRALPNFSDWRCQVERFSTTATVIRLYTARPKRFRLRRRRDGESGTRATTSNNRQQTTRRPLPGAEAARRAGAPGGPPEASRPAFGRESLSWLVALDLETTTIPTAAAHSRQGRQRPSTPCAKP